jgi:restriction system protein
VAIPDFQSLMLPLLKYAADGEEHSLADARAHLAREFSLSEAEVAELLPSGRQALFGNRVSWAKIYLVRALLLESPRRAFFKLAPRGREVLEVEKPARIDLRLLSRYPEIVEFRQAKDRPGAPPPGPGPEEPIQTPEEILESAYLKIRSDLIEEVLTQVKKASPAFFERLVVDLLVRMGYGGSREDAGQAVGRGGDEGIDGVINEDRLGLDTIYLQAKRWEGTVGRPEIQKFVGALHGKRAKKGVFLTTSCFSSDAREYVAHIDPKVILIDGAQLAHYMVDFKLGVTVAATYELKRVDSDYFAEE